MGINPIFRYPHQAAWLGLTSNQTVLFKSNFNWERINRVVKTGEANLPIIIIYKVKNGGASFRTPRAEYRRFTQIPTTINVSFDPNSNAILPNQEDAFNKIVESLKQNAGFSITINGNSDRFPNEELATTTIDGDTKVDSDPNVKPFTVTELVDARANAIFKRLVSLGINPKRISIAPPGYGLTTQTSINVYNENEKPDLLKEVEADLTNVEQIKD